MGTYAGDCADFLGARSAGLAPSSNLIALLIPLPLCIHSEIRDLSDILQNGSLTRDEFAVAMHLINNKLAGRDLPQQLPPSLVPPSLRGQTLPEAVNPQREFYVCARSVALEVLWR